jgi:hypothetical protein
MYKKSVKVIAFSLLLCFTAAALPFDFFHNHTSQASCAEDSKHTSCHHKLHISKTENHCFACSVHFDKVFILSESVINLFEVADVRLLLAKNVEFYFVRFTSKSSRGPPLTYTTI